MLAIHKQAVSISILCLATAAVACSAAESPEPRLSTGTALGVADLRAKDLAIAFSLTSTELVPFAQPLGGRALFPASWYSAVISAFQKTDVGDALTVENQAADWRVVSARIAPCAPLGPTPLSDVENICWPEVRLVFQPILRDVNFHQRASEAFADDRAIHAIYPVPATTLGADAAQATTMLGKIRDYSKKYAGGAYSPLSPSELAAFSQVRNRASRALIAAARGLRGTAYAPAQFDKVSVRPESDDTVTEQKALRARFVSLLTTYTPPAALHEMTAFSLPEGREPAGLDTWVFIAFDASGGEIKPAQLTVRSPTHGRQLLSLGLAETVSTGTGDPRVFAAVKAPNADPELKNAVIALPADIARLSSTFADRTKRLVPNVSCASCHMANGLRFDFHNFGYLEDRDLTASPRVLRDVELDLARAAKVP
jgi:hypothetical protein